MHHYQQMIKNILRLFIPKFILNFRINKVEKKRHFLYKNLSMGDIFSNIYSNKEWGKGNDEFFSGSGTHNVNISKPYIEAVEKIIESSTGKQVLVDIGSGDFSIGRNFIHIVDYYYACDVVFDLQNYNRKKFNYDNVEFVCIDATKDDIPNGDILILRQVLQHLSNKDIKKIINKCYNFDKWIVSEHIPSNKKFIPNRDISTGCGIRVLFGSGVVLTEPPFNVTGYKVSTLVESYENNGVIRTTLFEKDK